MSVCRLIAADLIWKSWDDCRDWIVFHKESRQTHLLDELSAAVLRLVERGCGTVDRVAEELIREFEMDSELQADAANYVSVVIARLVELGLVCGSSL